MRNIFLEFKFFQEGRDPFSGETFIKSRKNQKFKNKKTQIAYNNLLARKKRKAKRPIDSILDKNREILKKVLREKTEIVLPWRYLKSLGFNFSYFTHLIEVNTIECKYAFGIYEFIVERIFNNNFRIYYNANKYG